MCEHFLPKPFLTLTFPLVNSAKLIPPLLGILYIECTMNFSFRHQHPLSLFKINLRYTKDKNFAKFSPVIQHPPKLEFNPQVSHHAS